MLQFYLLFSLLLTFAYSWLIMRYRKDWLSLPTWSLPKQYVPKTKVSILVPARNESENIQRCLQSLLRQNYPETLYEILVIDDHSEDDTAALAEAIGDTRIKVLRLADYPDLPQQAFKKLALATGIEEASGRLIVTTDADCFAGENWLPLIVSCYECSNAKLVAAPVNMIGEKNLLERFQSLDFCGMMGITGAGIHKKYLLMGNGANLAYEKAVFEEVGGFEGIDHLASGDDILLMQKIAAVYPEQLSFVKNPEAVIFTNAQPTWQAFIQQRVRWASKSAQYPQRGVTLQLATVYLFCCNILLSFLLIPFGKWYFGLLLFHLAVKAMVDNALLGMMCRFFQRRDLMKVFWPAQFLHIAILLALGH